jgi:recombination protein RecA
MARKRNVEEIEDKDTKLKLVMKSLTDKYGQGIVDVANNFELGKVPSIPSSSLVLNQKLGRGGFVRGRMVEVFGEPSGGKSSLALDLVANAQRLFPEEKAFWCDAEFSYDEDFAGYYGVDTPSLILSRPTNGEEALEVMSTIIKTGLISIAVVDSVSALVPQEEQDASFEDKQMALQPRLMSKACRKLTRLCAYTGTLLVWVNQVRSGVGPFARTDSTGGNALKFHCSYRISVSGGKSSSTQIKVGDNVIGHTMSIKIVKNKLFSPFKSCELDLLHGIGFDVEKELVDLCVHLGLIEKKAAYYVLPGEEKPFANGMNNVRKYFKENPTVFSRLSEEVHLKIKESNEPII